MHSSRTSLLAVVSYLPERTHILTCGTGAGESLAAESEGDKALRSKQLELGFLASLACDPGGHPSPHILLLRCPTLKVSNTTHILCESHYPTDN